MTMSRRALCSAVSAALAVGFAQPAYALDLMEAWRSALANDALVASSRSNLNATRERVAQARGTLLPAVTATGGLSEQAVETNTVARREFRAYNYGVNLSYPLFRMQNVEAWEQSRLAVTAGEAALEAATQDLMIRVSQAYFDVLASQDSLRTIRTQKRAITEQLASARRNFEVGTATITDQQEAQSRYDLTVAQELAAENDLAVKRAALALLTGKPVSELDTLRPGVTLQPPQPTSETDWIDVARKNNLTVQQQQVSSEVARREIDRQRYGHYPTLDLVSGVTRSSNASAQLVGVRSLSGSIGVQLSVPIYAGGTIDARVREALALHDKSLTDLENTRRQAEQAARTSYLGVNSGLGQVRALEAAERSSQLALDSNVLGYQVGVRINVDVLNALQQLFTTRRDLSKARYDVLVNGLRLKQNAGTLSETDLRDVSSLLAPPQPEKDDAPILRPAAPVAPAAPGTAPAPGASAAPGAVSGRASQGAGGAAASPTPGTSPAGSAVRGGRVSPGSATSPIAPAR